MAEAAEEIHLEPEALVEPVEVEPVEVDPVERLLVQLEL
jgi:hypothetical protein